MWTYPSKDWDGKDITIRRIYLNEEKIHEVNVYGELKSSVKKSSWDKIKEWFGKLW